MARHRMHHDLLLCGSLDLPGFQFLQIFRPVLILPASFHQGQRLLIKLQPPHLESSQFLLCLL